MNEAIDQTATPASKAESIAQERTQRLSKIKGIEKLQMTLIGVGIASIWFSPEIIAALETQFPDITHRGIVAGYLVILAITALSTLNYTSRKIWDHKDRIAEIDNGKD
jgi:hypothetical protein